MKSLFVRNIYEQDYDLEYLYYNDGTIKSSKILPTKNGKLIRQETIIERDIDTPPLKQWESVYDKELDTTFVVNSVKRTTDNTYVYVVDTTVEVTENSIKRKEDLENKIVANEERDRYLKSLLNDLSESKSEIAVLYDLIYQLKKRNKELYAQIPPFEPMKKGIFSRIFMIGRDE